MIICKEFLKENGEFVSQSKAPLMVLDLKHFQYNEDVERFGHAIEVINVLNSVTWLNKICVDLQSDFYIDTAIFYEILDCIFKGNAMNHSQLSTYFKTQQDLEYFSKVFGKVVDTDRNFDLPFDVDFILLGLEIEKYYNLSDDNKADLNDEYIALFSKVRSKVLEISVFIEHAKQLFQKIDEAALETSL